MNYEIFKLINNLANHNKILDKAFIFISKYPLYIFMMLPVLIFILGVVNNNSKARKMAVNVCIITAINIVLNFVIGKVYFVNRPFVSHKVNLLYHHKPTASFPSDHTTITMSIALGLGEYNKFISIILGLISVLVGFSRIYVGHHYPLDVLAGIIIPFITSYVYEKKLKHKVEGLYDRIESYVVESNR